MKRLFPFNHRSQATLGLLVFGWVIPYPSAAGAVAELPLGRRWPTEEPPRVMRGSRPYQRKSESCPLGVEKQPKWNCWPPSAQNQKKNTATTYDIMGPCVARTVL